MIRALGISLSALKTFSRKIETSSNNLANIQTTGFKSRRAVQQTVSPGGTKISAITANQQSGGLIHTNNPLDLSIVGRGFFEVSLPNGKAGYTRSGQFTRNGQGRLSDVNGNLLRPSITIPGNATSVAIDKTGVVSALTNGNTTTLGQLNLSVFPNPGGLKSLGKSLFEETQASGTPIGGAPNTGGRGKISSGFLEASNVDIAREMVNMMTAEVGFKASINAIKTQDKMIGMVLDLKA